MGLLHYLLLHIALPPWQPCLSPPLLGAGTPPHSASHLMLWDAGGTHAQQHQGGGVLEATGGHEGAGAPR